MQMTIVIQKQHLQTQEKRTENKNSTELVWPGLEAQIKFSWLDLSHTVRFLPFRRSNKQLTLTPTYSKKTKQNNNAYASHQNHNKTTTSPPSL